jgi:hypothetical protein
MARAPSSKPSSSSAAAAAIPLDPRLAPSRLVRRLEDCRSVVTTYASKIDTVKNLPASLFEFLQFFSKSDRKAPAAHLQRLLTRAVLTGQTDDLRASAPTSADQCRLTSLSAQGALSFLNASADDLATHLPDVYYQHLARLTLGLPASPELRTLPKARCACGFLLSNDPVNHLMTCKGANQSAIIKRHDRLNKTLQQIADELGLAPINERILANGKRLDGDYALPHMAEVLATDWSVAHSAASSYASTQATTVPGYASLHRANRKIVKYDAQVKKQGGVFLPLIAETFGSLNKNVIKVLIEFRKAAENAGHPNVPTLISLRHRLSAALVTGNYHIVQNGLDKMTRVV